MDDSTVTAVARAAREPGCFETVESVRHGGTRDTGLIGKDSHWDRFRLHLEQEDENRELEVTQPVTSEGTAEATAQSFGDAKMSERKRATCGIDPVPPAGERKESPR